ncbi:hypothetical protein SAMN05444166_4890 [Singulisphaera sp. GP187]|uniref:hypothetical protein n=1 Tax=Singulisphaera sp. GP187 TaxID=1882752 RepID=UPI000925EA25|nr:hypothetical protein [Singulisphaera sp. GP187]SIO45726.1 hypothetical protein SAMN05444166_4890 [Singulisphaera sp. GP187]
MLHPFLIAVFPILSLYAHNVDETPAAELVAPIGLILIGTLAVWVVVRRLTGDTLRSALATSLLASLFFTFDLCTQAVNGLLNHLSRLWGQSEHHVHPLPMLGLLALAAVPALLAIWRRLKEPWAWTSYLNAFSLILVALPTGSAAMARMGASAHPSHRRNEAVPLTPALGKRPDIYYIILDTYACADVMKNQFGFDNGPFLTRLEQKGFFVARQSTANYCQTRLSLCSSLNFDYLQALIDPAARDLTGMTPLIGENRIIKSLRPLGYKYVSFSSGYDPTEHPAADVYLRPRKPMTAFHRMLIGMTPMWVMMTKADTRDFFAFSRERTLFVLNHLPDITKIPEPTFTFAHILCPHPPFVFGEQGEDISPRRRLFSLADGDRYAQQYNSAAGYRDGYRKQSTFLTKQVEHTIERILATSPEPPVIILQSDHGSALFHHVDDVDKTDLHERMGIINCFYFPDKNYEGLTDRTTPVNSFRIVLNHVFGASLPLREPRNYFSTSKDPLDFIDVTKRLDPSLVGQGKYAPPSSYGGLMP